MSRDVQSKSIPRQRADVLPHCEAKGYAVVAEKRDDAVSGSEVERRPGLQAVLALAREGKIDGIVVDALDRLARLDLLEMGELLAPLRRAGVWVETVDRGRLDFESMGGRLMLGVGGEIGRGEQIDKAHRSLTAHLAGARDRGRPPLPKPPYGYRREPIAGTNRKGPLLPDDARAPVVRDIFRWFTAGRSVGWVAEELARRGVPSPTGNARWRRATLRGILANPVYAGERAWGKVASGRFKRQRAGRVENGTGTRRAERRPREEWFVATDDAPPLVERDVWDACQQRLARGTPPTPCTEPGAFLLSGLLRCGECGSVLTGFRKSRGRPGVAYVCSSYAAHGKAACVRVEVAEAWAAGEVVAALRDELLRPERLAHLQSRLEEAARRTHSGDNLARLKKAVAGLEGKLARARGRLVEVSKDMVPEVEAQIRTLRGQLDAAGKALHDAETADPVRDLKLTVDAARGALWRLESALEGEDRPLLAEALRGILSRVVVGHEAVATLGALRPVRRRPVLKGIAVRPGSGLDLLADLDGFRSARSR
jgi:site-specific DNA recombinase